MEEISKLHQDDVATIEKAPANSKATLTGLPHELVTNILHHLPPESLATLQATSHQFKKHGDDQVLWRFHCRTQYRFWNPKNKIADKFALPISAVDWKKLFITRRRTDRQVATSLRLIVANPELRVIRSQRIIGAGYDAKDELLRQSAVDDSDPNALARRYHSNAILSSIHRAIAVKEWEKLWDEDDVPLERALGAFDMFTLENDEGDLDDIAMWLDKLADKARQTYLDWNDYSTRTKALTLCTFMRANGLTGVKSDDLFRELQNNFIGLALYDEDHQSLPIISSAIYSCLAERLGFYAKPCGFPNHIYTIVRPTTRCSLDGRQLSEGDDEQEMFVDPYKSDEEVFVRDLVALLRSWGVSQELWSGYLRESPTRELVLRVGMNLSASVQSGEHPGDVVPAYRPGRITPDGVKVDFDRAFYGFLWMYALSTAPRLQGGTIMATPHQRQRILSFIAHRYLKSYPIDVGLFEDYFVPHFEHTKGYEELLRSVQDIYEEDEGQSAPEPKFRSGSSNRVNIKYRVGQVFQHKRYNYEAVIIGWSPTCQQPERWIHAMGVDQLPDGRHQSFYHSLNVDRTIRYVAEENIQPIDTTPSEDIMHIAGAYFKRYDTERRVFVSNIRREYPED